MSREVVEKAVEANDFDSMKRKEIRDGGGKLFKLHYPVAYKKGFALLRKGQEGDDAAKECFDVDGEDEEYLNDVLGWRELKEKLSY